MEVALVGIAFMAVIGGLTVALIMRGNRTRVWQVFAQQNGLHYEAGGLLASPVISGRVRGVAVRITIEHRGSGNNRRAFTRADADFAAPLPSELKIGKEGLGASLAKIFGGQDIQLEQPELDATLRIQGHDARAVKRFLGRGDVGRLVQGFVGRHDEALVTTRSVCIVISGHTNDPTVLLGLLEHTVSLVRRVEQELRWAPDEAGRHVPTARRPYEPPKEREVPSAAPPQQTEPDEPAKDAADNGSASTADQMIASLARDGVQESRGEFTLDREVAQQKMRDFQLEEPDTYALELVQAAVLKGAERIAFDIDTDDMRLRFDGRPFTAADFDLLYNALFTSDADPDTRARQRLAIGVNAALGSEPKYIRVVSGDGERGARMVLQPGKPDEIEKLAEQEVPRNPGTELHVKSRLGQRLAQGNRGVVEKLEACCQYARAAITLGEKRLSGGTTLEGAYGVVEIRDEHLRGSCGFKPNLGRRGEVRLVTDGVWISRHRLDDTTPGLLAVVESDRFTKDLSQGEILRDRAWRDALLAVYEAERRAVDALSAELGALIGDPAAPSDWAMDILTNRTRSYSSLDDFRPGGDAEGLARAPLWRTVADTAVSLRSLIAQLDKTGHVDHADYTTRALGLTGAHLSGAGIDPHRVLLLDWQSDPRVAALLTHLFGDALRSRTDDLQALLGNR